MRSDELESLVRRWNEKLVAADDAAARWPVRESGTVLRPGASEEEIAALEERLGVGLPPSYREFLAISNGAWAQAGWGITAREEPPEDPERELGFLDVSTVGWFRDRDRSYLETWAYSDEFMYEDDSPAHYAFSRRVPEVEYLDHEREQDSVQAKSGHLRYALQVSSDVDGYKILLNPLVVDGHGEWEAWDFGSKMPGAMRYRSFAALLETDIAKNKEYDDYASAALESSLATFQDESRSLEERVYAAMTLATHGEHERVLPFLVDVVGDQSAPVEARQAAARSLGYIDDERAVAALVDAAADAEPRLQAVVVPPLANRDEPVPRRAALAVLTAPGVADFVISSVWPGGGETVWQAWNETRDPRLLIKLAHCHDRRALGPLGEAIVNPDVALEHREWLIRYAWWPADAAVVPALVAAAELPDTPLLPLAQALGHLGAEDQAVAVYARALRSGFPYDSVAAPELGLIRRPEARNALLEAFREKPSVLVARALGWHLDDEIATALVAAADDPEWRIDIVDALEKTASPAGREALAELVAEGDLLAARALARQRDERALPLLLEHLVSDDDALAFEGADGLRDLRSPAAASPLLSVVEGGADDDVVACAAHALVSMRVPKVSAALHVLARSTSAELRRLAEIWR